MRAAWYQKQGPARDLLVVGEMPDPKPGPGEARIPDRGFRHQPRRYQETPGFIWVGNVLSPRYPAQRWRRDG
jgi:hypothetical protein